MSRESVVVNGTVMQVVDVKTSCTRRTVEHDLSVDAYGLERIPFEPGDVVVDVGANIGMISIYLALKYPFITVYAIEPVPQNYDNLMENIKLNGIENIRVHAVAITGDGRDLDMIAHLESNSGGATGFLADMHLEGHQIFKVPSLMLSEFFRKCGINKCKLLKVDCEGAEYEILLNSSAVLRQIEYLSGEFHVNKHLTSKGYSPLQLIEHCSKFINRKKIRVYTQLMAE